MKSIIVLLVIWSGLMSITSAQSTGVFVANEKLEKFSGEFQFTEGPTRDKDGNIFFTDQPNNRIMKSGDEGKLSEFLKPAGRANGLYFAANGNLLACADEKTELW